MIDLKNNNEKQSIKNMHNHLTKNEEYQQTTNNQHNN